MRDLPVVNASIEGPNGGDTIVYREYVDLSIAVATEKGLVTPVVRNAEAMSMIDIERAISEIGKKVGGYSLSVPPLANHSLRRRGMGSSPSRTWRAAPSPSATGAFLAP